ncbi:MAG: peptidoglycan-binding protein [Clostridiales bacterium]|nr:peptidoglycan-binding protein [Clostridiales bacterium]
MATIITNAALIAKGKELLAYALKTTIPYVNNGMTLQGMDCQGLVEYCLIEAGVPKKKCGLAGSNAHWRACVWRGTPEECKKAFGSVPAGAALFIWANDDGEPSKYKGDGMGNASHIGLWLGNTSIAASASRGRVIESNFKGKTINGGWNMIGLLPWVDYGLSDAKKALLTTAETTAEETTEAETAEDQSTGTTVADTSGFYTIKKGCKGGAVERLQTWLVELGYTLEVDHEFGPATDNAVRYFQKMNGLTQDGIVGQKTWAALAQERANRNENAVG